jgi:phosphatidylinositol alpha-mannosyltransferase
MASGAPVVASDIDGYRTVATDGADAVLVPPGDAPALAAALADVLAGGPRIDALVEGGRKRADTFSMQHLAELYLAFYGALVR